MSTTAQIGRWQGAALLATTLLGTGVFILPQLTLEAAGVNAIWVWLLLTVLAIPVTVVFGALAGALPHAAGPAHFVSEAFGALAGRITGLLFVFVVPVGASAALMMTWSFIEPWFRPFGDWQLLAEMAFLVLLWGLNRLGFQLSAKLQLALTLSIVAVVLLMLGLFAWIFPHSPVTLAPAAMTNWEGIGLALALGFWSFLGVEAMTHLAQDFRDPKRDMLPALLIGLTVVGLIYLGCSALLWWLSAGEAPLTMAQAFDRLCGGYGQWVIGILGLCSGLATVNVYTASVARLCWSFSQQGVLPAYLRQVNRHQVPERALIGILMLMAMVILGAAASGQQLADLIGWVNGVFILIYLGSMAAALRLLPTKYQPLVWVSLLICVVICFTIGWLMSYALLIITVITPLLYLQQRWQRQQQLQLQVTASC